VPINAERMRSARPHAQQLSTAAPTGIKTIVGHDTNGRAQAPSPAAKSKREPARSRFLCCRNSTYRRLFLESTCKSQLIQAIFDSSPVGPSAVTCVLGAVNPRSTISGGGAGVGVAVGDDSVAGAGGAAGAGVGVAAGGGFTGAEEADGVLGRDGLGAAGSLPAALRTAETNASEAWGVGTDPVRIDLKSTMRP